MRPLSRQTCLRFALLGGVLLALVLVPGPSYAQPILWLDRFESEDGLSHDWILDITQDPQGFLWVATSDGLNRYDGYEFVVYQHQVGDTTSLRQNVVSDLEVDAQGDLWIAAGGLHRLERSTGRFLRYDLGIGAISAIPQLAADGAGFLWVAVGGGLLYRFDPRHDTLATYGLPASGDALSTAPGRADFAWGDHPLSVDAEGVLWVGTTREDTVQLHRYEAAEGRFRGFLLPTEVGVIQALYAAPSGRVWVGGARLGWWDLYTEQFTEVSGWTSSSLVRSLYQDEQGLLWVGTEEGLYRYHLASQTWERHILDASGSAALGNFCRVLFEDRAGAVWVGTHGRLYRHDPHRKPFRLLQAPDELPGTPGGSMVMALDEDPADGLWLGTLGGGLLHLDRTTQQIKAYRYRAGTAGTMPDDVVWALHRDRRGMLWVGTSNGLATLDPSTARFELFSLPNEESPLFVYAITEDPDGLLWITARHTVYQIDPVRRQLLKSIDVFAQVTGPDLNLQETLFVPPATLWIASLELGLLQYDLDTEALTVLPFGVEEGLLDKAVYDIHRDASGMLWLGTGSGLARFDPVSETFQNYYRPQFIPGSLVFSVLEDEEGRFWLGTNQGLARFDPGTEQIRRFDAADGAGSTEFNRRSAFRGHDGVVYMGGVQGVTSFVPAAIADNPVVPPILLTRIHRANRDTTETLIPDAFAQQPLVLSYRDYALSFEFAALNFTNPQKNQYSYKLDGFDAHWIEAGTRRRADYTNLPPGRYVFRVRGSNNDGVWNTQGAAVNLVITPPWWKTSWAYLSYVLLGLGLFYGIVRGRSLRLERQNRVLTQRVAERTAEIEQQRARIAAQARKLMEMNAMKSRFFANISHEFRTPLTLIRGPLEDLGQGRYGALPAATREALDLSLRNTERLQHLIDQLLALSRLEAGKLKLRAVEADLVQFTRRITSAFTSLAESRGITLNFEASTSRLPLFFDPPQLEHVLNNLLSNAFKFTPEGGCINVAVVDEADEADVRGVGSFAILRVADTGVGVPEEALPHLFERFYQVDASATRSHEGTGIGLALVKELVGLHGGSVEVESRVGVGTTFTVHLPQGTDHLAEEEVVWEPEVSMEKGSIWKREDREEAERKPVDDTSEGVATNGEVRVVSAADGPASDRYAVSGTPKILIVEDNKDLRVYLRSHLADAFTVLEAPDGVAGLEVARESIPDLIISDVMMPGMDGFSLLKALREDKALCTVPVILLTARAAPADRLEGLAAQADDYLTKPFSPDELNVRVRNLIGLRRTLRTRYSQQVVVVEVEELDLDSTDQAFLNQACTLVEANLGDTEFTVQTLADGLYMSKSTLERRLKTLTGQTPAAFVRQMRLQRAHALLTRHAIETVAEAAYAVGFSSVEYFSRLYQRAYGKRPSEHLS